MPKSAGLEKSPWPGSPGRSTRCAAGGGRFVARAIPWPRNVEGAVLDRLQADADALLDRWIAYARSVPARELRLALRRGRAGGSTEPPGQGASQDAAAGPDPAQTVEDVDSQTGDDPPAPRRRILIDAPLAVRVAFDEVLDLHRAVSGSDRASVAGFCEALVADSVASGHTPPEPGVEFDRAPRLPREQREREMDRIAARWEALPPVAECVERASRLLPELRRLAWLEDEPAALDAGAIQSRMEELLALRERLWVLLGGLLAEMSFLPAWNHFGFVDAGHYAEKRLRLRRSTAERRMRLARALRSHARVRRGYERGWLGAESARLVVRALGREPAPETVESAWVRAGMSSTVKYLRDVVVLRKRSATRRERPGPPPDESEWNESLRREPERTRALVEELGERAAACPVANDAIAVLLTFTESCQLDAALQARREALRRTGEALAAARRAGADGVPCPEELPASLRLAETFSKSLPEVPPWVGLLAMLEDYADTWDDPAGMPRRAEDRVYDRDAWRCRAPGCTSRRNLEAHHIQYRSRGGSDEESNLVTLCATHHRQGEHGDLLRVEGEAPLRLSFRLGRGGAPAGSRTSDGTLRGFDAGRAYGQGQSFGRGFPWLSTPRSVLDPPVTR